MERSVIQYEASGFTVPSLRNYKPNKRKEEERRQTRYSKTRTHTACGARHGEGGSRRPSAIGRARLPAFHRRHLRQRPNATAQLQSRTSWDVAKERALPTPGRPSPAGDIARRPVIMPAGRFFPKPPGSGLQIRPREPHSPHLPVCLRKASFLGEI